MLTGHNKIRMIYIGLMIITLLLLSATFTLPAARAQDMVEAAAALPSNVLSLPAAAQQILHEKFHGKFASAMFTSNEGCIDTYVIINAVDSPGKEADRVFLTLEQFDICTIKRMSISQGTITPTADEFQIKKFDWATLNASIEVVDLDTGASFPVQISVNWTGIGEPDRSKTVFHFKTPSLKQTLRLEAIFRQAEASGSLSYGTTNLILEPGPGAHLFSEKSGSVTIIRE